MSTTTICRGRGRHNARGALIEHDLVEDNRAEGIFYEISQDAVIRNNRVYRNGVRAEGWYWDGGITVACQLQRRGLRQPAVRQLQRHHRSPAEPARVHPADPPPR